MHEPLFFLSWMLGVCTCTPLRHGTQLDDSSLSGRLPSELAALSALAGLDVENNFELTGPIPSEYNQLSSMFTLLLANNKLEGPIDSMLVRMSWLVQADFAYNSFTGEGPGGDSPLPPRAQSACWPVLFF